MDLPRNHFEHMELKPFVVKIHARAYKKTENE
jgi:hypothetical protein